MEPKGVGLRKNNYLGIRENIFKTIMLLKCGGKMVERPGTKDYVFRQILAELILRRVRTREKNLGAGKVIMLVIQHCILGLEDGLVVQLNVKYVVKMI